jgi:tetratricopeptide (TPR) repeat protein
LGRSTQRVVYHCWGCCSLILRHRNSKLGWIARWYSPRNCTYHYLFGSGRRNRGRRRGGRNRHNRDDLYRHGGGSHRCTGIVSCQSRQDEIASRGIIPGNRVRRRGGLADFSRVLIELDFCDGAIGIGGRSDEGNWSRRTKGGICLRAGQTHGGRHVRANDKGDLVGRNTLQTGAVISSDDKVISGVWSHGDKGRSSSSGVDRLGVIVRRGTVAEVIAGDLRIVTGVPGELDIMGGESVVGEGEEEGSKTKPWFLRVNMGVMEHGQSYSTSRASFSSPSQENYLGPYRALNPDPSRTAPLMPLPKPPIMPRLRIIISLLVALSLLTSCSKEARKTRALRRAEAYFSSGQFDNAKIEYLNVLRLDPGSSIPYEKLGFIWSEEGAPLRAAPFLFKSRELASQNVENRLRLARILGSLGRRSDAIHEATQILEQHPENGDALRVAAETAQTHEEVETVEQQLRKFSNPNSVDFQLALGTMAARRGNREAVEKAAQQAVTLDPRSAPAHFFMGTYLFSQQDREKAGQEFKLAAELAPPRSRERVAYARFSAQMGASDEALKTLHAITAAAPDFLPAWNLLAELSLGRNNYDECLKDVANVLNRDSDNIDANILEAKAWLGKGDKDKAIQMLERIDTKYPGFPPVKYELARCYLEKNDTKQATTVLNEALAARPDFIEAALLLGQINLRTGRASDVVESMRGLLSKHPDTNGAKLLLADAYRVLGRLDDAADIFRTQIKISPENAEALMALGIILRQQQKNDEARQVLDKARKLAPNNLLPLAQLVDLDIATGNHEGALRRVQEQLSVAPDSAIVHFLQGQVYIAERKWEPAEAALTKAVSLNPNFSSAYALLASTYMAAQKLPDAAQQLEILVRQNPKNTQALMNLGVIYEKLNDLTKARDTYEKLLGIAPEFAPALNNLAFIYAEHFNQLDRGYELAQKARGLQPGDSSIADTLGWVCYKRHDYQQAIVFLQESASKSPNEPEILYHLGMAQYMMGQLEAARTAFEQALKSPADFPNKTEVQRRLSLISGAASAPSLSVEELKSIVAQQPDDVQARTRLAAAYEEQRAFSEAAGQYEEILKLSPKLVSVLTRLGELYLGPLNNAAKAVDCAKRARDLSPGDSHATLLLGRSAYKTGNYSWAYSLLKENARESADGETVSTLGWAAFYLGKVDEAKEPMRRVINISPSSPEAADAKIYLRMIEIEENPAGATNARQEVETVLKRDAKYLPAQLAEGAICIANGDSGRAAVIYEDILRRLPDFAPAQKRLAALYATNPDRLSLAYDLASKARKSLPDDAELTKTLAEISYQRKDYPRAVQLLRERARNGQLDANNLYYFGMSSLHTKETAQARAALTQALATGLKDPFATDARRALEDLSRN